MITSNQWEEVHKAYKNLFYTIAHNISGDKALAHEDYVQMLHLETLQVIEDYEKKINKFFDEIWKDPKLRSDFNKWLKTCLWNYKNTVGSNIQKRLDFYNKQFPLDTGVTIDGYSVMSDYKSDIPSNEHFLIDSELNLKSVKEGLDENSSKILSLLLNNSECLTKTGAINKVALVELSKLKQSDVDKSLDKIRFVMQKGIY